jgi:hypothetical protein
MRYSSASVLPDLLSRASGMTSKDDLIKLIGLALSDGMTQKTPRQTDRERRPADVDSDGENPE